MSLSSALNIALTGLQATTTAMGIVSGNISNASTPGYTEKSVNYSTVTSGGGIEGGVEISGYTRATNQAVTASLNTATSSASYYSTQYNYLQQVQSILDSSSSNPTLSSDISNFQTDFASYADNAENSVQQQTVINDGNKLAKDIQSINSQVTSLSTQVSNDVQTNIKSLNADLATIQTLNTQISNASSSNQPTGDLQDQLATAVNAVSAITNVTVMPRSNGQIALYTPSGTALVDGTAQTFSFDGTNITNSAGANVTSGLTGGSLQAQLNFISTSASAASSTDPGTGVIVKLQSQLQTLVTAFTGTSSAFATAYKNAANASTATGGTQNGDTVPTSFFTVTVNGTTPDISSFQVNAQLLNSTGSLPQTGLQAVTNSFTSTANYTASGLSVNGATYATLGTSILSNFQAAANSLQSTSSDATSQQSFYQTALANTTGVNTDSELVALTTLQNSYAASAHIITTIENMYSALENIGTTA